MAVFIAIFTFLIVVVLLLAVFAVGASKAQHDAMTRLGAIVKAEKRGASSLELKLMRDQLLSDLPLLNRLLLRWKWSNRLHRFLTQADVKMKPGRLLMISAITGLATYLVVGWLAASSILAALAAAGAALLPLGVVAFMRSRRLRAFERTFPEAIDLLGRAVRAGHAFTTGLEMIATEMPEPVAGEFRKAFDEQNFGLPLREALLNLCERVPLIDVRFFVTALMIQKETGGNLAEILDNLAHVVRERFRILGEVRIRTAQGRLSAAILIALPPLVGTMLRSLNPEYMQPLFTDPWGPYLVGTGAVLQLIGSVILWKIVNIEV